MRRTSGLSLLQQAIQSPEDMEKFLKLIKEFSIDPDEICYNWRINGRQKQLADYSKPWFQWLMLCGRGAGKSYSGSQFIREQIYQKGKRYIALVGATSSDTRDVMVLGDSGLLKICPKHERPEYKSSQAKLIFPNGAVAKLYSAEKPDRLRGANTDCAWCDEIASWARLEDTVDNLLMGLRLSDDPKVLYTTTPRPLPFIKELIKDPTVIVTRGSTMDNADNLSQSFIDTIVKKYSGTRLGAQEINGEILDENPNALFNLDNISRNRVPYDANKQNKLNMHTIIVGVDPAVTSKVTSDDTGIVVSGVSGKGADRQYYVLADFTIHGTPDQWAQEAVKAYHKFKCNRIVCESNQGGDLVKSIIKHVDGFIPIKMVHASRGKLLRAEPISLLYENNLVHHIGIFPKLEDEMCQYDASLGQNSPDRLDALVWSLTSASKGGGGRCSSY